MSAKEMFEKLGYEFIEQNKSYLRYRKKGFTTYDGECVDFDLKNKKFRLTNITCQGNRHFKYGTITELQAINKQVEELGWNDEN